MKLSNLTKVLYLKPKKNMISLSKNMYIFYIKSTNLIILRKHFKEI